MSTPKVQSFRERIARIEGELLDLQTQAKAIAEDAPEPKKAPRPRRRPSKKGGQR